MGRPTGITGLTGSIYRDKLQAAGGDTLCLFRRFSDRVFQHHDQAGFIAIIGQINQYCTLLQFAAMGLQGEIQYGMHQRMHRVQQLSQHLAGRSG